MKKDTQDNIEVKGERIAKFIARAGIASRREAERIVEDGRISVNGEILSSCAFNVFSHDAVLLDGKTIHAVEHTRLWLYHKPRGLVTTHHDPDGRPTVFETLPTSMGRVVSVGRLDLNSEGLLLLTNNGELAGKMGYPSLGWERQYRVRAHGIPREQDLDILRRGVTIEGIHYAPAKIHVEKISKSNCWLHITLTEGKNREIRRLLNYIDCPVNRLIRIAYGPFELGNLPPETFKEVNQRTLTNTIKTLIDSPTKPTQKKR